MFFTLKTVLELSVYFFMYSKNIIVQNLVNLQKISCNILFYSEYLLIKSDFH
jgi:hypothetical protein